MEHDDLKQFAKFNFEWAKIGIYFPESNNDRCCQGKDMRKQVGAERMLLRKPDTTRETECV